MNSTLTLRSRAALALATAAVALTPAIATTAIAPTPAAAAAAAAACKKAKIGGQSKCIAAGQFCAKRYETDYRKYGYTCNKQDRNGRWHLQYR